VIDRRSTSAWLLAAAATAGLASACGSSGPTDRDQIASIISAGGAHPATLCSHLTDPLLSDLGGKAGCRHQAASVPGDPTTHATSIRVRGRTATAVVVDRTGRRAIRFVKQRGTWKVSGVG